MLFRSVDPTGNDLSGVLAACKASTDAGLITICAYPTPHRDDRHALRERVGEDRVLHVYVNTDPAICAERRPDVDQSGFEPPKHPDLTLALDSIRLDQAVKDILEQLDRAGQFEKPQ